ncbi:velvet factor [Chytriomyces cf. hyalinus JEL632]|nr:velvet factor [Chytriomyces cf. hyalinus JEL632]
MLTVPRNQMVSIDVVQQPLRARMCGFASADKRLIDPPPILKLTGGDVGSTNLYILSVSLWSENLTKDVSITEKYFSGASLKYTADNASSSSQSLYKVELTEGYDSCRVLWGGLAATCTRLKDLDGVVGNFFVFHDLSVRSSGVYRLKFELFVMNITGAKMTPIASTSSDIFTVYTPKSFPGILETTALSRWFAKQGVSVRLRQTGENAAG